MKENELIEIGVIAKPQGLNGAMKVKVYNEDSEVLGEKQELFVGKSIGESDRISVVQVHKTTKLGIWNIKIKGVETLEQADRFRTQKIFLSKQDLPEPFAGEFYFFDLEGIDVKEVDDQGIAQNIGKVIEVFSYPTLDCFRVQNENETFEIPYTDRYIQQIDASEKVMVVSNTDELPKEKVSQKKTTKENPTKEKRQKGNP